MMGRLLTEPGQTPRVSQTYPAGDDDRTGAECAECGWAVTRPYPNGVRSDPEVRAAVKRLIRVDARAHRCPTKEAI